MNSRRLPMALILLAVLCYFPVLFSTSVANPDAQFILPILISAQNPWDYFQLLINFQTLDFQPVRDMSLFLDIFIYQKWGIDSIIWQNLIYWVLSCLCISRIVRRSFPKLSEWEIFIIAGCFLAFPLFSQSVAWGMARKHLLSFLFILLATEQFLKVHPGWKRKFLIILFYSLSVLSQPISVLWPVWVAVHSLLQHRKLDAKLTGPLAFFMTLFAYLNYRYYEVSPVFNRLYPSKTDEAGEVADKVLALGHYLFQMFFPYILSYRYTLGHWSTLVGILLMGLFVYLLLGLKIQKKDMLSWGIFLFLPLSVVLVKATILFDTYLLIPSFGLLMLLLLVKEKLPDFQQTKILGFIILFFWAGFTASEAHSWRDDVALSEKSFKRRPNCATAYDFLKTSYDNDRPPETAEAKTFIYRHDCGSLTAGQNLLVVRTYLLFYEEDLPLNERFDRLRDLTPFGIFPQIALAALSIKHEKLAQAEEVIQKMWEVWGRTKFRPEYIPLVDQYLYPYCQSKGHQGCLKLLKNFTYRVDSFYYK